jgi:tryptophan synthase beta chain
MVGVEAGGSVAISNQQSASGTAEVTRGKHAARFGTADGKPGVLQGTYTYLLQDEAGNVLPTHSVAAGLDYPAIGPEHARLHDEGRVRYDRVSDDEALAGFRLLARSEGILPALESSHAIGWLQREARALSGRAVVVNLSGRGDKDLQTLLAAEGRP